MQKIVVIGSPGAGKSTFARRLGEVLGIDVYHLDYYFWYSGWHKKPKSDRVEIQQSLIQRKSWIIEGTYLSSSDERLHAADTIIFLDIPLFYCLWHILNRRIEFRNKLRPDLPEGCREKLRFLYILKVLAFPHRGRRLFLQKIRQIEDSHLHQEKQIRFFWLKSNEDIEAFLRRQVVPYSTLSTLITGYQKRTIFPKAISTAAFILGCLWISLDTMTSPIPHASL